LFRPSRLLAVATATVVALSLGVVFGAAAVSGAAAGTSGAPANTPTAPPGATGGPDVAPDGGSAVARAALSWALARLGTPYRWGGTGPGGFDCSGLVQAAYGAAGVALPRVAQAQFDAGPALGPGDALVPGDLVFFGASPTAVDHVGIALGDGTMVDAPHTGAVVRVEGIWSAGYIGATRPAP
jgi:cell wall-associated NlpC family hydrolase